MMFGEVVARAMYERAVPVPEKRDAAVRRGGAPTTVSYLCDGGSSPNPGVTQPIACDGTRFLWVPAGTGGNHRAVYQAIEVALDDAAVLGAEHVCVWLFSRHVWGQLTDGVGVDRLTVEVSRTRSKARGFASVEWLRVAPPVIVLGTAVRSRKAFRRLARRSLTTGSTGGSSLKSVGTVLSGSSGAGSVAPKAALRP